LEVFHDAFLSDLLRCSIWDYCVCVHGAIVIRDRIRDKDKDPSFSAKQTRAKESVWTEINERPVWRKAVVVGTLF
jgi:hypothetical protein